MASEISLLTSGGIQFPWAVPYPRYNCSMSQSSMYSFDFNGLESDMANFVVSQLSVLVGLTLVIIWQRISIG